MSNEDQSFFSDPEKDVSMNRFHGGPVSKDYEKLDISLYLVGRNR